MIDASFNGINVLYECDSYVDPNEINISGSVDTPKRYKSKIIYVLSVGSLFFSLVFLFKCIIIKQANVLSGVWSTTHSDSTSVKHLCGL